MAAAYARALLDGVEEVGLDELLLPAPLASGLATGIPLLDAALQRVLPAPPQGAPSKGATLIEVVGSGGPCSGKTQLLYRAAAGLLLSSAAAPGSTNISASPYTPTDGPAESGGAVVWLDAGGRFSATRLAAVLQGCKGREEVMMHGGEGSSHGGESSYVKTLYEASHTAPTAFPTPLPGSTTLRARAVPSETAGDDTSATLSNLLVLRPRTFVALLAALHALPARLLGPDFRCAHRGLASRRVAALIVVDAAALPYDDNDGGDDGNAMVLGAGDDADDDKTANKPAGGQPAGSTTAAGPMPAATTHRTGAHYHPVIYRSAMHRSAALLVALRAAQARLGCTVLASGPARSINAEPGAWDVGVDARVVVRRVGYDRTGNEGGNGDDGDGGDGGDGDGDDDDNDRSSRRTARFEALVLGRGGRVDGRVVFYADAGGVAVDGEGDGEGWRAPM